MSRLCDKIARDAPDDRGARCLGRLAYEFQEAPLSTEDCVNVLNLMHTIKGVTFYDAAYHVLAIHLNGLSITADAEYTKRARRQGHIRLLSAWDAPED